MARHTVSARCLDPYRNFRFRLRCDGRYVAGISKVSGLTRATGLVTHRHEGDPRSSRKSPGRPQFEPVTLERGVTHDLDFQQWASTVSNRGLGPELDSSSADLREDVVLEVYNEAAELSIAYNLFRCWVSEYQSVPELDAAANAVAIQILKLETEGWERHCDVAQPS